MYAHVCACVRTCVCVRACVHACVRACVCVCVCCECMCVTCSHPQLLSLSPSLLSPICLPPPPSISLLYSPLSSLFIYPPLSPPSFSLYPPPPLRQPHLSLATRAQQALYVFSFFRDHGSFESNLYYLSCKNPNCLLCRGRVCLTDFNGPVIHQTALWLTDFSRVAGYIASRSSLKMLFFALKLRQEKIGGKKSSDLSLKYVKRSAVETSCRIFSTV